MMIGAKPDTFPYRNIDSIPETPYVRIYLNPTWSNLIIFNYVSIDSGNLELALIHSQQLLDNQNRSGYLHWTDGTKHPINREHIYVTSEYD